MVTITRVRETTNFVWPTQPQRRQLLEIVFRRFPALRPDDTPPAGRGALHQMEGGKQDEFWREFELAFRRIAYMRRLEEPDHGKALTYWTSEARNWFEDLDGRAVDIHALPYLAAALSHGDIPYVVADPTVGSVWTLGVSPYSGRPATDKWRRVLETEQLLTPTPAALHLVQPQVHPVRIFDAQTGADITFSNARLWR